MGSLHNDLHSWAAKARMNGNDTISLDLETVDKIVSALMGAEGTKAKLNEIILQGTAGSLRRPDVLVQRINYRGYVIDFNPPPIPSRECDWQWHHDDFDGAPDGNDIRCGASASSEAAKAAIDEQISEAE